VNLAYLNDPKDARVVAALDRKCGICRAKPGQKCRHPWETKEVFDRLVHLERAQQHMDKGR
jgi:hypothetical protein